MIVRTLRLRHGRIALSRPIAPITPYSPRRWASTEPTSREEAPERQPNPFAAASAAVPSSTGPQPGFVEVRNRPIFVNDPDHPVTQDYVFFQHQKSRTQHLGSKIERHYRPHDLLSNPPSPKDITLELLMASQTHLGHATRLWNPANAQYIFGVHGQQDPIHIISLDVTAAYLRRACKIVSGVTERGGLVLFVGTRHGQARTVVKAAELANGYHLFTKWIPGSITNGQQILGQCAMKVIDELDQEVTGFEDQLRTHAVVKPDLVVCLNPLENYTLLHECGLHNIPTIGIIDTDANPLWVTYPIPANDDSLRAVQVICGTLGRAGQEGQAKRAELAERGITTYKASHKLHKSTNAKIVPRADLAAKAAAATAAAAAKSLARQKKSAPAPAKRAYNDSASQDLADHNAADEALFAEADAMMQQSERAAGAPPSDTVNEVAESNSEDGIDPSLLNAQYGDIETATKPTPLQSESLNLDEYKVASDGDAPIPNAASEQPDASQQYGDVEAVTDPTDLQSETLNLDEYHVDKDADSDDLKKNPKPEK